jgi:hypothetical protein
MLNESEDNIMKKLLIKILVAAITFIVMNTSIYSLPYGQLGNFRGAEQIGFNLANGRWVSIL